MKRHWRALRRVLFWLLIFAAPLWAQHEGHGATPSDSGLTLQAGPYRVALSTEPAVIPIGKAKLRLKITDSAGKPVEGATVRALVKMPNMNMGEREQAARPQGEAGVYVAPASFSMAGGYVALIKISGPQGNGEGTLALQTGQNTAAGGLPHKLLWWILGAALLAFTLYKMRRSGQKIYWRGLFTRPVIGGIAVLLAMLALVVFAVNNWRRPGAMTPLEAQGMEMSMPPPPGVAAVELASVQRGSVQSRVRYTGQAVGYVEQDIYPRVTGNLLWMPFYAGDKVRRGQLLARLDTSQIEPQIAQQRAAQAMAQQNAITMQGQFRQALADVNRARAEAASKRGALAEALSDERKARAEIGVKIGQLAEARSDERKARAEIVSRLNQLAEARSGESRARSTSGGRRSAVEEARSGESRAKSLLAEATTALRGARGAAQEAQSDLAAAREDKSTAEADLTAAQAQVTDAEAQLQAAQAEQEYWTKEIARMRVLVEQGAVSREEFQREQAQAETATARVRQAQAQVGRMQAEARGAQSRIRRADAMIRSAEAKADQAEAAISGSQARIEQAKTEISGAQSRVQQMEAEAQGAGAEITGAGARIRQMEAEINAARAEAASAGARIQQMEEEVRAARAEAASAGARIQQVRAEIEAAEAGVRGAQAQVEAARGGIGQAQAGVEQASAGVAAATTLRGYTEIRSLVDGVVTQRRISPGTLVQPGQAILQVAQINPIRLQANVAESDLKRVRVGSTVTVRDDSGKGRTVAARVTSVAPAVDPQTRTGLVEAIVPNSDARFLPGEFVAMEIETGQSISNLTVPADAIVRRVAPTGSALTTDTQPYVWVAEPISGDNEQFVVRQVKVRIGISNGHLTEILSGLREGQRVVTIGHANLKEGDTVTTGKAATPIAPEAPQHQHGAEPAASVQTASVQTASVTITENGFEPANVPLKAGMPVRLTFTRKTEATCATDVVFPDFKIKRALPLNRPIVIEFTPKASGEIVFGCGMDLMLRGKVVAR